MRAPAEEDRRLLGDVVLIVSVWAMVVSVFFHFAVAAMFRGVP